MIQANVVWKIDPVQALTGLSEGIKRKCIRQAANAAGAPIKAAAIAQAPSDKGNLRKAMRIKVKSYRNNSVWVVMIGASKSYKRVRKLKNKKKDRGGDKTIRPSVYQPIINKTLRFMQAAANSSRSQAMARFTAKLTETIQQEINKRG